MVFSSNVFLIYFLPIFLMIYFISPKKWRNVVLLMFSLVFYAYGAPDFILLLVGSCVANFYLVKLMHKSKNKLTKKLYCAAAIIISLGLLIYYKYANFFVENINHLLEAFGTHTITFAKVLLPIGISFFTFQSITYVIDTYRGNNQPMDRLHDYVLYIMMFPQLIAGPIVRYCDIEQEIRHRNYDWNEALQGFYRFIIGLSKKILISDVIGIQVDKMLAGDIAMMDSATAWITIVGYTMQLYFDFSGYSDMAIGLGKMLGFTFLENFNYPYISRSITDFWRRWHISLSSWFREYLYIPLGGNRNGALATYRNLLVVWLCTGFWHGASWNYILWGLYYFVLLSLEKAFMGKVLSRVPRAIGHIYSLFFIIIGWLLFVSEDIGAGFIYLGNMFGNGAGAGLYGGEFLYQLLRNLPFIIILVLASTPMPKKIFWRLYEKSSSFRWIGSAVAAALAVVCIAFLVDSTYNPFLYFRF